MATFDIYSIELFFTDVVKNKRWTGKPQEFQMSLLLPAARNIVHQGMKAAGLNSLNQRKHSHQDEMFGTETNDLEEFSCQYPGCSEGSTIETQQKMAMHRL